MTAAFHPIGASASARTWEATATSTPAPFDTLQDCMAGVFKHEEQAAAVLNRLQHNQGLRLSHSVLLGPEHADWRPFRRQARSWARRVDSAPRTWLADSRLLTCLGGVAAALAGTFFLLVGGSIFDIYALLVLALVTLAGAIGGWSLSEMQNRATQHHRFDLDIRGQLRAGCWVVLVHDVPWAQQAAVFNVIQDSSTSWFVVSDAKHAL